MRVEFSGLTEAVMFLKRAPRKFQRAMAVYVNNQAVTMRENMIETIGSMMTLRDTRFVRGSVVYRRGSLGAQPPFRSSAGSIERDRFTGWIEQETGKKTPKKRDLTTRGARRGSWKRKAVPSSRMRSSNQFLKVRGNVVGGLRAAARKRERRALLITGDKKIPAGLYRFKGQMRRGGYRPLQALQYLGGSQPRRRPWARVALNLYSFRVKPQREWSRALRYVFQ